MSLILTLALGIAVVSQRPVVGTLAVGDPAPNFKLRLLKDNGTFELKSNFGKRPTVLIFGSYT